MPYMCEFYPAPGLSEEEAEKLQPTISTKASAGVDIRAHIEDTLIIHPGKSHSIPTGYHVKLADGVVGLVCPRSGLALNHRITVGNAPGTIDEDYHHELRVILHNHGAHPFLVNPYDRIAQLVPLFRCKDIGGVRRADDERTGGFGSTGIGN